MFFLPPSFPFVNATMLKRKLSGTRSVVAGLVCKRFGQGGMIAGQLSRLGVFFVHLGRKPWYGAVGAWRGISSGVLGRNVCFRPS